MENLVIDRVLGIKIKVLVVNPDEQTLVSKEILVSGEDCKFTFTNPEEKDHVIKADELTITCKDVCFDCTELTEIHMDTDAKETSSESMN